MNRLYTIPAMALFTACASITPSTSEPTVSESSAASAEDIPLVVKKRPAKYVGIVSHPVEYTLKNSFKRTETYKKRLNLATFIRDDKTTFTLSCSELDARTSLGLVTIKQPHTSFKEASELLSQELEYTFARLALKCPTLEA